MMLDTQQWKPFLVQRKLSLPRHCALRQVHCFQLRRYQMPVRVLQEPDACAGIVVIDGLAFAVGVLRPSSMTMLCNKDKKEQLSYYARSSMNRMLDTQKWKLDAFIATTIVLFTKNAQ